MTSSSRSRVSASNTRRCAGDADAAGAEDPERAIPRARADIEGREEILPPDHLPRTLEAKNVLGDEHLVVTRAGLRLGQGDTEAAAAALERAYEELQAVFGPEYHLTLQAAEAWRSCTVLRARGRPRRRHER